MGLRLNTVSCIALLLLVHYSHFCLYKGSLLYYIIQLIQYTDFQSLTMFYPNLVILQENEVSLDRVRELHKLNIIINIKLYEIKEVNLNDQEWAFD